MVLKKLKALSLTLLFLPILSFADSLSLIDRMLPPEDISTSGHLITWLFNYTTYLNLFFFMLVCIGLFGFSYLYNHKRHPKPHYTYGNKKAHMMVALAIGISVFVGIDMNITRMSNDDFLGVFANWPDESQEDVERIEVMAQQWAWNFRYAGKDGVFNTEDDVLTLNDLRLPINKKIVFQLISKDVVHSLYIPNILQKIDAIPGRMTRMWTEITKPGVYDIACAEMCGTYHYRMQAKLTVYNESDYHEWLNQAQEKALEENDTENPDMFWGWKWQMNTKKLVGER